MRLIRKYPRRIIKIINDLPESEEMQDIGNEISDISTNSVGRSRIDQILVERFLRGTFSTTTGKRRIPSMEVAPDDNNEASSSNKKSKYEIENTVANNDAKSSTAQNVSDANSVSVAGGVQENAMVDENTLVVGENSSSANIDSVSSIGKNVNEESSDLVVAADSQGKGGVDESNLVGDEETSSANVDSERQQNQSEANAKTDSSLTCAVKIKSEPLDTENLVHSSATTSADVKPTINIKKEEATSTSRESCKFGIRCYRRNPMHRIEEAHPGDHDYKRPIYPLPPTGTPNCPYGNACYRRNPTHFQEFTHPPQTDFEHNWKTYCSRLRQRFQNTTSGTTANDSSDLDDYDLEDPFQDDGNDDPDFLPSEDQQKNTSTEESDDDECDKAEE